MGESGGEGEARGVGAAESVGQGALLGSRGGGQEGQEVIALDATLGGRFEEAEGDLLGARVGGGIGELLPSPANGVGEID
ncbi:MAG TPA: hypothetical protein RMH80_11900, partial [Polyangiaceae bacterium LLY-WYZ-15_(1-7)]|nr:hypothetical protein [Polyangiaceae bacterium LLY-WYZ-15_(1-7)]